MNDQFLTPALKHFTWESPGSVSLVLWEDSNSGLWEGPHELITWGRGYACVSSKEGPLWLPVQNIKPYHGLAQPTPNPIDESAEVKWTPKPESPAKESTASDRNDLRRPEKNYSDSWRSPIVHRISPHTWKHVPGHGLSDKYNFCHGGYIFLSHSRSYGH